MGYEKRTLKPIENFLVEIHKGTKDSNLQFRRCLNEAWFTNTLAWLLSPKGSHGYNSRFLRGFVEIVAKIRSSNNDLYKRRKASLKFGKQGSGTIVSELSLRNASVTTEFYLTEEHKRKAGSGIRFCDLAILDLDVEDRFLLILENKLFSENEKDQLRAYLTATERRFNKAMVREYVYLTLDGSNPKVYEGERENDYHYWVRMSWIEHILDLLQNCENKKPHPEVIKVTSLLKWIKALSEHSIGDQIASLHDLVKKAVSHCLREELQRLCIKGVWQVDDAKGFTITHSSCPKRRLTVELQSMSSVALQCHLGDKPISSRLLLPLGINAKQFYSILDFEARHIYDLFFPTSELYLYPNKKQLANLRIPMKVDTESNR